MADMHSMAADHLPYPVTLRVECPCCGVAVEYEPAEDDAGAFHAEADWPVCETCHVLIDVPPVRIVRANSTFHQRGGL